MAATSAECEQMIDACERAKVKLMVAYRLHFDEGNLAVVDLVKQGKLGQPRFMTSVFSQQVSAHNSRTEARHSQDPLYDVGVYCINAIRYVFRSEPLSVMAHAASRQGDPRFRQIDEQLSATLLFPDDRLATLVCSFGAAKHGWYEVVGTEGIVRVDPAYTNAQPLRYELTVNGKTKSKKFKRRDQVAGELAYFATCIKNDQAPEPAGEEGLADLRIIEAIQESVRTGRRVSVDAVETRVRPSSAQVEKRPAKDSGPVVNTQTPSRH
jgi:predicted dehydrogenase